MRRSQGKRAQCAVAESRIANRWSLVVGEDLNARITRVVRVGSYRWAMIAPGRARQWQLWLPSPNTGSVKTPHIHQGAPKHRL